MVREETPPIHAAFPTLAKTNLRRRPAAAVTVVQQNSQQSAAAGLHLGSASFDGNSSRHGYPHLFRRFTVQPCGSGGIVRAKSNEIACLDDGVLFFRVATSVSYLIRKPVRNGLGFSHRV